MTKITVFGATGGTGKEVIQQALATGYKVTALVRNPAAFKMKHENLTIVQGDVLQTSTFEKELVGAAAIISCLGSGRSTMPTQVYSEGLKNIISAMDRTGVQRLICVSAGALYTNKEMGLVNRVLIKLVLQPILKEPYADMRLMEKTVAHTTLNWTIVRPPRLTNNALTGHYRTAIHKPLRLPFSISRADLADYMLSIIDAPNAFRATVTIAY
jgi:putative NADH-flavin reductase